MPTATLYKRKPAMAAALKEMAASQATMKLLANGVVIRLGCGPIDREPCLHYFTAGNGMMVFAWPDGATWGVEPVVYHILGSTLIGPSSRFPRSQK